MSGRAGLKLDKLRVFVLDEADTFFLDNRHMEELNYFIEIVNEL